MPVMGCTGVVVTAVTTVPDALPGNTGALAVTTGVIKPPPGFDTAGLTAVVEEAVPVVYK